MSAPRAGSFEYCDRTLGDREPVVVATAPDVFYPTSTTVLLLRAVRKCVTCPPRTVLDLGCGCGVVGIVLARRAFPGACLFASDLSAAAVRLTQQNAERHGVTIDCRQGSVFEPWVGMRFDVIVDDVSGIADPIAVSSPWYPPAVPCDADRDGTRWVLRVLAEAPSHLVRGGRLFFPVLSLSNAERVLDEARRRFPSVRLLEEQWYPLTEDLLAELDLIRELAAEGIVRIERRGSRWWWATRIYVAE